MKINKYINNKRVHKSNKNQVYNIKYPSPPPPPLKLIQ